MNASPSLDRRAMLQELRTNRRTQVALAAFVVIMAYLFWPDAPKTRFAVADTPAGFRVLWAELDVVCAVSRATSGCSDQAENDLASYRGRAFGAG